MWIIITFFILAASGAGSLPAERFIATECYGNVLTISCQPGHRIKVLDDFFGASVRSAAAAAEGSCQYEPGDCTVPSSRHTSVIHRYCEGRQSCSSFQVDRRFCGHNQTTYEQVEYNCIPDLEVTNICTATTYTARSGYIATPNFPNEYPPNLHCSCSLSVNQAETRVLLEATHFIIKYDSPCKDWVEISMGGQMRRLCGAYKSTLFSDRFNLTFHSDEKDGHQGLWLYFSVYPEESNATLLLSCWQGSTTSSAAINTLAANATNSISTPISAGAADASSASAAPDPGSITANAVRPMTNFFTLPPTIPTRQPTRAAPAHPEKPLRLETALPEMTSAVGLSPPREIGKEQTRDKGREDALNKAWERRMERKWRDMLHSWFTTPKPPKWWPSYSPSTRHDIKMPRMVPAGEGNHRGSPRSPPRSPSKPSLSERDYLEEKRRKNKQLTGIVVISVCAGGIVLLVIVLVALLCVKKRSHPKLVHREMQQHSHRLQQRLNSLSFYDSIPLYDSARRSTAVVTRAPKLVPVARNPQDTTKVEQKPAAKGHKVKEQNGKPQNVQSQEQQLATPQETSPDKGGCKSNEAVKRDGPYWDTIQLEAESDRDSAIYAELDKHSRGEASEEVNTPSTLPRRTDAPEMEKYSLQLGLQNKEEEEEEIYTHV